MREIQVSSANQPVDISISVAMSRRATGRVVAVNKNSVSTTVETDLRFFDHAVTLTIPASYVTTANLPATFTIYVTKNGVETVLETVSLSIGDASPTPVSPTGEFEIKNETGASLATAGSAKTTGTITTSTGTVPASIDGYSAATFYFYGTFAGANITFEQSPDSTNGTDGNWFTVVAGNISSNTVANNTGAFSSAGAWDVSAPGAKWVRARATALTSGTLNVLVATSTSTTEATPTIPTHAVTQSGTWTVTQTPTTTLTSISAVSAATTNATSSKTSAGSLFELTLSNPTATPAFFKLYNKASAPTVGTDVPVLTISVPASSTQTLNFGPLGKRLSTGIAFAITAAIAATDTAVAVAGIQVHGTYV